MGTILGILIAVYFGAVHGRDNFDLFEGISNMESFKDYLDDWKDILPQSVTSFISDVQAGQSANAALKDLTESFAVGNSCVKSTISLPNILL